MSLLPSPVRSGSIPALLVLTVASVVACGKTAPAAHETSAPTTSTTLATPPQPSTVSPDAAAATTTLRGTYKSEPATLYIPATPDWKGVRWTVKETSEGIGDGPMTLTIDTATGRVGGALEGPLGPAVIDGFTHQGTLTATVARKDPSDQGFAGTLIAAVKSGHADGTMSLSLAQANALRQASFTLLLDEPDPTRR